MLYFTLAFSSSLLPAFSSSDIEEEREKFIASAVKEIDEKFNKPFSSQFSKKYPHKEEVLSLLNNMEDEISTRIKQNKKLDDVTKVNPGSCHFNRALILALQAIAQIIVDQNITDIEKAKETLRKMRQKFLDGLDKNPFEAFHSDLKEAVERVIKKTEEDIQKEKQPKEKNS
jgi:hypothetical protein